MEALYTSLALMAVPGITFIAYKHPVLYEKQFSPKIYIASGLVLFAFVLHNYGVISALKELTPYLKDGVGDQVKQAIENAGFPSLVSLGALGIFLYSLFLSWLSDHMQKEYALRNNANSKEEQT